MSIIKAIRRVYNETFVEPRLFSHVAKLLREGAHMVQVRYNNRSAIRYYTGSGIRYGNGNGKRARWMMEVTRFDIDEDGFHRVTPAILPWMDQDELELLLTWDTSNVRSIEVIQCPNKTIEEQVTLLKDIAGRLKPGMGYNLWQREIHNDLIDKNGYVIHNGPTKYVIPEHMLNTVLAFPVRNFEHTFDPEKLFVQDEKKVKRQHRSVKDLKRWTVVKQLPSVEDKWVIKYTHTRTAGDPVFYYGLNIDIDSKAMKGYPFYITELVNGALRDIRKKHGMGVYEINDSAITITWDGITESVQQWMAKIQKFPGIADNVPVVIYEPLQSKVNYNGHGEVTVIELKDLK